MTNNVLDYLTTKAIVQFDADNMRLLGEVRTADDVETFTAMSVMSVREEYEKANQRLKEREDIRAALSNQMLSLAEVVESGEATIHIDRNDTDLRVGMMVKMLLSLADGASFLIQERLAHTKSD